MRSSYSAEQTLLVFETHIHSRFDLSAVRSFLRRLPAPYVRSLLRVAVICLAGCANGPPPAAPTFSAAQARASIEKATPRNVTERSGWATDIYAAMTVLSIEPTRENICAVIAVIEQESGFRVDPVVPGLPAIAWREIDSRAERAGVPRIVVHTALQLQSSTGRTYSDRIDSARTEKDLSDIFEDFIGAVPMGRSLFGERNPVRTRGPMQVNIEFAERYASTVPYPYPVKSSIADEVFTRRGGVYFGTAHLLAYSAPYDSYLYRFADFNAGQYASRNAAFQSALSRISGIPLVPDGALIPHDGDPKNPGNTESAVRALGKRLNLSDGAIHSALEHGKGADFEQTPLYRHVFELAERVEGRSPPRATLPRIQLHSPKISRKLTTEWYARRVDQRFHSCLNEKP
jgi:hypothetical protein